MTARDLLEALWRDHLALAPHAARVHDLLTERGELLVHDHVALLAFGVAADVLARPFVAAGWRPHARHHFAADRMHARSWRHADPAVPALLVGELAVDELSPAAQAVIARLVAQLPGGLAARADLAWSGRPWQVSHADYHALAAESAHAAWIAAFGLRAHHFTVDVDSLSTFPDLAAVAAFLAEHGFRVDDLPRTEGLEQIATRPELARVAFTDTAARVPGCRYQLARRHALPTGERFSGFLPSLGPPIAPAERGKTSGHAVSL